MESATDTIRFIDCNHPGVIYVGTQECVEELAENGGQPCKVSESFVGFDDGEWEVRSWR